MGMRIMVVGGGAREHALCWKLAQSPETAALWCAPGNPGTATVATNIPVTVNDLDGIVAAAKAHRIDLVFIGPEEPLALGIVDRLAAAGIAVCGPSAAAARIESSKSWAKEIMRAAGVPTAGATVVTDLAQALAALPATGYPVVLKADGLAAGKGVVVATTREEAVDVLTAFMAEGFLGAAGSTVLIEEHLTGQEISVFCLSDGEAVVTCGVACDYKRAGDGDAGPNTGGMGAYAPVPAVDAALLRTIETDILVPTIREMAAQGAPFRGVLYAGLILTTDGPKVIEFNARLGDPETQVVLPLLDADLPTLFAAVAHGTLASVAPPPPFSQAAVTVVLASGGYPGPYPTGIPITGLNAVPEDVLVFHAGTSQDPGGQVVTSGGRVLSVVGTGPDLAAARARAYAGVAAISFQGAHHRTDIALRET